MAIYDVQAINQKNTPKNKKKMTAQEMAVFTREEGRDTQTLELEDTTTNSKKAGWFGFGSWFMSLFSDKIEFNFNGTTIKGKNGYQVRGGVVPLFSGVVLDLTPASLRGAIDPQTGFQMAKMEPNGGKPKLVLSPQGSSFITEHELDEMSLGAEPKGEASFEGSVLKAVEYPLAEDESVMAESLLIEKNKIVLNNPMGKKNGELKPLKAAVINESGINVSEDNTSDADILEPEEDAEEQTGLQFDLEKGEIAYTAEAYSAKVNLLEGTFRLSFGTLFLDSEEEGEEEEEEKKTAKDSSGNMLKDLVKGYYDEYKEEAMEYWEKLGFAKDAFLQFCNTGKLPENKYEDPEEENESGDVNLEAEIPLFPGLSFKVSLEPSFSFGVGVTAALENNGGTKKDREEEVEVTYSKGQVQQIKYPAMDKILKLGVMLRGSLGAKLSLMLSAGIGYLINLEGGVTAEGNLSGNIEGEGVQENTFGMAETSIHFLKETQKSPLKVDDKVGLAFTGGLSLDGNVGTEGKVASKLFDWEKELWQYTFKEWHIGDLSMQAEYEKKEGASPLSIKGWKRQSSSLELNAFGRQMLNRKKDNFGLRIEENESIDVITESSKHTIEDMKVLVERLKEIQGILSTNGGNFVARESETYKKLTQEMMDIQLKLNTNIQDAMLKNELIRRRIEDLLQTDQWKENQDMANKGIQKHQERIDMMESWNETTGKHNMNMRDYGAMAYYKEKYGNKAALNAKKEDDRRKAIITVATKNKILEYEKERMIAVQKKQMDIINQLQDFMQQNNITDVTIPNAEVIKKYKSLGGKEIFKQLGVYGSKESMLTYEREQLAEATKKHTERVTKLKEKQQEMQITPEQLNKPNETFARYYYDLGGHALFKTLITNHIDIDQLIEYENNALNKTAGKYMNRIKELRHLQELKNELDPDDVSARENIEAGARQWYFGVERAGKIISNAEQRAKTATKQDILDYEMKRLQEFRTSKQKWWQLTDVAEQQRLLKVVKDANANGGYQTTAANSEWSKIKSIYTKWAKRERTDKEIQELITIKMLANYEQNQVSLYAGKKDKKSIDRKRKHENRFLILLRYLNNIDKAETEEEKEKLTKEAKETYYSSKETGENRNIKGVIDSFKKGEMLEAELIEQAMSDVVQEHGMHHEERIKMLREYMGLPEDGTDTSISTKNDSEVYQYYAKICNGKEKGFYDYWAKLKGQKQENVTIDEMLRFEIARTREVSREGMFSRLREKYSVAEGTEREAMEEAVEGGHYDRYHMLLAMKEKGSTDEEVIEAYKKAGGSKNYEKFLESNKFKNITPGEIIAFEEKRVKDIGAKNQERIDLIESKGDDVPYEELEREYRKLAQVDGTKIKDKIKATGNKLGVFSGSIGYDEYLKAEEVLSPQQIIAFEEKKGAELSEVHRNRISMLEDEKVTDANVWEIYSNIGGGDGFQKEKKVEIESAEKNYNLDSWGYNEIVLYEQGRRDYYQSLLDKANEPMNKLKQTYKELELQKEEALEMRMQIAMYFDEEGMKKNFKNSSGFNTFVGETESNSEKAQTIERALQNDEQIHKETQQKEKELDEFLERQLVAST